MPAKKQQVRLVFKLAAFGAFIMLGWLGIRNYRASVEKMRTDKCIEEIGEIVMNMQDKFSSGRFNDLDYKLAAKLQIFPKSMFREGSKEALNSYMGGVDIFYSALSEGMYYSAWEISFQGLSQFACINLIKMNWTNAQLVAVAGYGRATPSGVLDEIYPETIQDDIKQRNIFKGNLAPFIDEYRLEETCSCGGENVCTVVWKFR